MRPYAGLVFAAIAITLIVWWFDGRSGRRSLPRDVIVLAAIAVAAATALVLIFKS